MCNNSIGVWTKYEKQSRSRFNSNTSFNRLYEDLKNSNTMWHIACSLETCEREICGEDFSIIGSRAGDIFVYYIYQEGKKVPKMYFKTVESNEGKLSVLDVHGANLVLDPEDELITYNFNIEPQYLSELILKLKELGADRETIEKYEMQRKSFEDLKDLSIKGIRTSKDILILYSNFTREDTTLARTLMKGRCVQEDFDRLDSHDKEKMFRIISSLNNAHSFFRIAHFERLEKMTIIKNASGKLLEISDRDMIIRFATDSNLKSLYYANEYLKKDREFVLEVLRNFKIGLSPLYEKNLPQKYMCDIEALVTMTASKTFRLREVIESYLKLDNVLLKEKLKDINFVKRLLQAYYRSILNDRYSLETMSIDTSILWHFSISILEQLNETILIGPELDQQREDLKRVICNEQTSTRSKIIEMRLKRSTSTQK